eukprot:4687536-Prymnesium_polylepis.2
MYDRHATRIECECEAEREAPSGHRPLAHRTPHPAPPPAVTSNAHARIVDRSDPVSLIET